MGTSVSPPPPLYSATANGVSMAGRTTATHAPPEGPFPCPPPLIHRKNVPEGIRLSFVVKSISFASSFGLTFIHFMLYYRMTHYLNPWTKEAPP